ncbi:MAG: hypothetical protein L0Z53_05415 [Acidobacteriales bacterium]|nr:hypothetical protein [Terriglobales bacterium]
MVVSLLIVWHLASVFLAALSIPPTSPLVINIAQDQPMQWYLDLLYLNHGHYFFAPQVGPGFLIHYELRDGRGSVIGQGQLPDKKEHRPRLWYHRHFMLADQAGLQSDNKKFSDFWQRKYLESYARHLLRVSENAQSVRMQRIVHYPLPLDLARQGREMDDPESYETVMEVTQRRSDLGPEPGNQGMMWQSGGVNTANRWSGGPR